MPEASERAVTLPPSNQRPVFIISDKERLSFTVGDTTFQYRRITPSKHSELRAAHTERGLFDEQARRNFLVDIATYCLCGWDNLRDMEMRPVPFLARGDSASAVCGVRATRSAGARPVAG